MKAKYIKSIMAKANRPHHAIIICYVLITASLIPMSFILHAGMGVTQAASNDTIERHITSSKGVEYAIYLRPNNAQVEILAENPTDHFVDEYITLFMDDSRYDERDLNITAKGNWTGRWDFNREINVLRDDHSLTVSTIGNSTQFNFTKEINSSDPGPIPTPYIEDVQVENGTIDGEPSAVARVTIANPSIHPYPLKLIVHTQETDGSFYGASVPPGENRTITVELLDERGTEIAGEARLYAGNLSRGDGAMDQVGFVGTAGEETSSWNESYQPIDGPWRDDAYQYRNESLEDEPPVAERLSGGYTVFGIPVVYVVSVFIVLGLLYRWK